MNGSENAALKRMWKGVKKIQKIAEIKSKMKRGLVEIRSLHEEVRSGTLGKHQK